MCVCVSVCVCLCVCECALSDSEVFDKTLASWSLNRSRCVG